MLSSKPKIYSIYWQRARAAYERPVVRASIEIILSIFTMTFLLLMAIRPTLTTVVALRKRIADQEMVEKKLTTKTTQLVRAQGQLTENAGYLDRYLVAVPENYDFGTLSKRVEIVAKETGVKLEQVTFPKVTVVGEMLSLTKEDTKGLVKKDGEATKEEIQITVRGNFESLKTFVEKIEKMDRLIYFTSIKIKRVDEGKSTTSTGKLRMTAKANSYYLPGVITR